MVSREQAVYVISVAAELAGMHPQTLRTYERKGLLRPMRTAGNTRRYSPADIERLRRIHELTNQAGMNLSGARMVLELEEKLDGIRRQMSRMAVRMRQLEASMAEEMRRLSREAGAILPARSYRTLEEMWREANSPRGRQARAI